MDYACRPWQRNWKKDQLTWERSCNKVTFSSIKCNPWFLIKQFHPGKNDILTVVRLLDSFGASLNLIAAALTLQKWKIFYRGGEWTQEDVKDILKEYRGHSNA